MDWLNLGLRRAVLALRRASMYPNQAEIIISQVRDTIVRQESFKQL